MGSAKTSMWHYLRSRSPLCLLALGSYQHQAIGANHDMASATAFMQGYLRSRRLSRRLCRRASLCASSSQSMITRSPAAGSGPPSCPCVEQSRSGTGHWGIAADKIVYPSVIAIAASCGPPCEPHRPLLCIPCLHPLHASLLIPICAPLVS
eukprot:1157895-Pelagomonas_calceolata.AAC.8